MNKRWLTVYVVVDAPSAVRSRPAEVGHLGMMEETVSHSQFHHVCDSDLVLQIQARTVHVVAALTGFALFQRHLATKHWAACNSSMARPDAETRSCLAATTLHHSSHLAVEKVSNDYSRHL